MKERLEQVYRRAERISIDRSSKIVCMSDCHRGVGNPGDNFLPNQNIFLAALRYYYEGCFCYIELGDGDELWENRELSRIEESHSDTYHMLSRFFHSDRLLMLYGNHDCEKKKVELSFGMRAREGVVLVDCASGHEIMLVHGHQGDWLNDTLWPLARFLVRYVWHPLEVLGVNNPTSASSNYKKRKKAEVRLDAFSEKKQILLIAGHTHRPVLPKPGEGFYLNDGCCVRPQGITAIEIERGAVTLVKWSVVTRPNRNLAVEREVLEGPYPWEQYWENRK